MTHRPFLIPLGLGLALCMPWVLVEAKDVIKFNSQQQSGLGITTEPVKTGESAHSPSFPASIVVPVNQQRVVMSAQAGRVEAIHVAQGATVRKGQVVASITSQEFVHLQKEYLQSKSKYRLAETTFKKDKELRKEGIISELVFLNSKNAHDEAMADLSHQCHELRLSGFSDADIKELGCACKIKSKLNLYAPMTGTVIEQLVTVGQRVEAGAPLCKIVQMSPLWAEVRAPLAAAKGIKPGMAATVEGVPAKVIHVVKSISKNDQTLLIRTEIKTHVEHFAPGQFVQASFRTGTCGKAHWEVPLASVVRNGEQSVVFVQVGEGFQPTPVEVVSQRGDRLLVHSTALKASDAVAMKGTAALKSAWLGAGA